MKDIHLLHQLKEKVPGNDAVFIVDHFEQFMNKSLSENRPLTGKESPQVKSMARPLGETIFQLKIVFPAILLAARIGSIVEATVIKELAGKISMTTLRQS